MKTIQMSTNKPSIGAVAIEISLELLANTLQF